jgi:hypothetical protein
MVRTGEGPLVGLSWKSQPVADTRDRPRAPPIAIRCDPGRSGPVRSEPAFAQEPDPACRPTSTGHGHSGRRCRLARQNVAGCQARREKCMSNHSPGSFLRRRNTVAGDGRLKNAAACETGSGWTCFHPDPAFQSACNPRMSASRPAPGLPQTSPPPPRSRTGPRPRDSTRTLGLRRARRPTASVRPRRHWSRLVSR